MIFINNHVHPIIITPPIKALAKKPSTYLPRLIPATAMGRILKSHKFRCFSDMREKKPITIPTYKDTPMTPSHPPFQYASPLKEGARALDS